MKKYFVIPLFLIIASGCSDDDGAPVDTTPYDLYMRSDAANTIIPLTETSVWNYKTVTGTEEKPDKQIKCLLNNDLITSVRILPVRQYDDNRGDGKYEYQTLCYLTEKSTVFFYMEDKILVGRYLQADSYGLESVIWDFELPTHCTESSSRYFKLNRTISDNDAKQDEDYLHEMPGYYTIDVEINLPNVKRYTNCKLFQYNSKKSSSSEATRINKFYFKEGVGLVRYQQFVQAIDQDPIKLYEQDIIEE